MNHFLDVGANIGQTFDDYLCKTNEYDGWKVWCFESSPRHLAQLIRKIDEVKDRFEVVLCPFGLHGQDIILPVFEKHDPSGDSVFENINRESINRFSIMSSCVSIITFLHDFLQFEDNFVLKLDCEGSEYYILEALLYYPKFFKRMKKLLVEFHTVNGVNAADEYYKKYADAGYTIEPWNF